MENWYPAKVNLPDTENTKTLAFLTRKFAPETAFTYAEIGIYQAATAHAVLRQFANAQVWLFDFDHTIDAARLRLAEYGDRVRYYGNTSRHLDSYNWPLMKIIAQTPEPVLDYVYLDGARTVAVDALAFFLCDKLLKPGGYIEFDDYAWRLRGSSMDPTKVPVIGEQYTDEQIDSRQIKMIVDILVRPDKRYREIKANRIFRKTR